MKGIEPSPAGIVDELARLRFEDVFNPYSDVCAKYDRADAPAIRRSNLRLTLGQASKGVDEIWFALEPGHRGARRTGLAMTDDKRLAIHANYWKIDEIEQATSSGPETEGTTGIVWEAVRRKGTSIFLWNAFPLHAHVRGAPLSNRRHTRFEREACEEVTRAIFELVGPERIFAIGREAHVATAAMEMVAIRVRHPSYGGKEEFLEGIAR